MINSLLDLIFPKKCVGCGKQGNYFCAKCTKLINQVGQICPVCERQSPFGQTHKFCLTRNNLNGLTSFFTYDGIIRNAIHQLKYKYITDLKNELWTIIESCLKENKEKMTVTESFIKQRPMVIPIPLYWRKENWRGFNQSSLFAQKIANYYHLQFSDKILFRTKNNISQTKLSEKERKKNIKGIFFTNPNSQLLITNCLLIDDVWTTGATLKEATGVLKSSGVKQVWGLTIAR